MINALLLFFSGERIIHCEATPLSVVRLRQSHWLRAKEAPFASGHKLTVKRRRNSGDQCSRDKLFALSNPRADSAGVGT